MKRKFIISTLLSGFIATGFAAPMDPNNTAHPAGTASIMLAQNTTTASNTMSSPTFSAEQTKAIQQIVHDYLVQNPQVLIEASQALQQQIQAKQEKAAMGAIEANKTQLFNDPSSPVAGNPKGTVTMVEFFDYQCGHCKDMAKTVDSLVQQNSNLKLIFKELPIFGGNSQTAAKAALAAAKQGKFYAFHQALMAADNPLNDAKIFKAAQSVGLNVMQLKKAMNDPAVDAQIKANFKLAQALQLMGTPAFVLTNGNETSFRFVPGATSPTNLQSMINELTQPTAGTTTSEATPTAPSAPPLNNSDTAMNQPAAPAQAPKVATQVASNATTSAAIQPQQAAPSAANATTPVAAEATIPQQSNHPAAANLSQAQNNVANVR